MLRKLLSLVLFLLPIVSIAQNSTLSSAFQKIEDEVKNHFLNFDANSALIEIKKQKKLVQSKGTKLEKGIYYHNYGLYLYMSRNSVDSIPFYYKKAEKIYSETNEFERLTRVKLSLISYYEKYDKDVALEPLIQDALERSKQLKNQELIYRSKRALAKDYSESGRQSEALKLAFEIEKMWDNFSLKTKKASPDPYVVFMSIYYAIGENEKTIKPLEKLLKFKTEIGDTMGMIQTLNNVAPKYIIVQKNEEKYLQTLLNSIELSKKVGHKYGEANAYNQLASYFQEHNLDSCKYYLDKIDEVLPVIEEVNFKGTVDRIRGLYYWAMEDNITAEKYFIQSKDIYHELGNLVREKKAVDYLIWVNEEMGDYKDAFLYQQRSSEIKDSLLNRQNIEKFKEIELSQQFAKQQLADSLEMASIQTEKELAFQQELSEEKQQRVIIISIVVLLLIIVGFVLFSLRRKTQVNKLLSEKNKRIEETLNEKQLLLKEIHHRVKNNLQIVSSLMDLQSKDINDQRAKELAIEGQHRVKAMALIHQKLYQNEDMKIELGDYIDKLTKNINSIYRLSDINTKINIENAPLTVDIDTAIPLGLILNELITNSFKYAFTEQTEDNALEIDIKKQEGSYLLRFKDSGKGLPQDFDLKKAKSLGLKLVNRLARQLQGEVSYHFANGAQFEITYKDSIMRSELD